MRWYALCLNGRCFAPTKTQFPSSRLQTKSVASTVNFLVDSTLPLLFSAQAHPCLVTRCPLGCCPSCVKARSGSRDAYRNVASRRSSPFSPLLCKFHTTEGMFSC